MNPTDPDAGGTASSLCGLETERIVLAAKEGGAESFGALYERIAPSLHTWAELRIRPHVRAWLEPGDLVQEVWCRALRSFDTFDPDNGNFRYWVFRIAKHVLLEAVRRAGSPAAGGAPGGTTERMATIGQAPDVVTTVSRRLARQEELGRFQEWVGQLEREDRELLLHHGMEGLTHAETAERMGLSADAVAKRWQRLRSRLEESQVPREVLAVLLD